MTEADFGAKIAEIIADAREGSLTAATTTPRTMTYTENSRLHPQAGSAASAMAR